MRGAVAVSAAKDGIVITEGKDALAEYNFNTGQARHFFCSHCGIYTFHERRSVPGTFGVNLACLEGHSPFDLASVPVIDGINHPSDGAANRGVVGHLLFVATPQKPAG